ncbi:MAG: porin [Marinosulfonomonas sp.]|nr:porin [Marinosulfonomonas sp.]
MKKILLTTTALVAFAGAASAEVSLSGSAEIGIVGGDGATASGNTQFHNDIDVKFTLSGETDNGLTFGATIDLDEAATGMGAGHGNTFTSSAVFVSGGFGTITMGDTDGALDWAMQETAIGSSLNDDETEHAGFNGNSGHDGLYGGQVMRYNNTFGDFGVALSVQIDDTGTNDDAWGLGAKYNAALGGVDLGLGLGYQTDGLNDIAGLSVDAKFGNGFRAILNYTDLDGKVVSTLAMDSYVGVGIGYTMDALTVSMNYGEYSGVAAADDRDGYAVVVNYDLGGGAVVKFGYGSDRDRATAISEESWSLGLGLSF